MSDNKTTAVIALGYFDSVHRGHKKVIQTAKNLADLQGAKTVVFTFKGNLRAKISNKEQKQVFTIRERSEFMYEVGVDEIFFAPTTNTFLSMGKLAFLNFLNKKYNIKGYVCGEDYHFGKFGKGDVNYLKEYAKAKNQTVKIVETENILGERISTTAVKKMLENGDLSNIKEYLGRDYSVSGEVFKDRKVGRKIGFPTVNIKIEKDKQCIKDGVYAGYCIIEGKTYRAVINFGARPTYSLLGKLLEAHIIDYSGDLYGKYMTVYFDKYLREIKKFESEDALKEQLKVDIKLSRG
ncbi:MAG: riboflavin biosynthesis protein RibF [Clostridiales bacterium]|nr:riboflavin biosynthesis protein RibF [Clostridiales bacterium]